MNFEDKVQTQDFYSDTMLRHHLSQKLKLIGIDKFHHIINILTFCYFIKKKELCNVKLFVVDYKKKGFCDSFL